MGEGLRLTEIPANMKTIGVLGGMGPQATMDFEQRVHRISQKYLPQKFNTGYPPMVVSYFREVPIRLNDDGSFADPVQPNPNLIKIARQIGKISDFLVITSNTPHFFAEGIEKASGKEMLSIIGVTIDEVISRGIKRVGVLAVGITLRNKLYQAPLEELGIKCETVPAKLTEELDHAIFAVMEGKEDEESRRTAIRAIEYFRQKNIDVIILGCTELPILLGEKADEENILNPSELLAEAAVKKSIGLM